MSQLSKFFCVLMISVVVFVGSISASDSFQEAQNLAKQREALNELFNSSNSELDIILNQAANSGYAPIDSSSGLVVAKNLTSTNLHNGYSFWWQYRGRIVCAILSSQLPQKYDFNNALIDAAGVAFDHYQIDKKIDQELAIATGLSFGTNYVIRKAAKQLKNNGISVENLARTCDILPEGIARTVVNFVVRSTVEIVTQPQVITVFVMAYIIKPFCCESD